MELEFIDQTHCIDIPDSRDFDFNEFAKEFAEWETINNRPNQEIKLQDQKNVPACTRFALTHIVNAENINEYNKNWYKFDQLDALTLRNRWSKQLYLQSALKEFRSWGLIEWSLIIPKDKNVIESMRKALNMWCYIYTWSSNWWRWNWKHPFNYIKRTDWKFVWHARDIVEDQPEQRRFKAINSRWENWWDKWYFYIPYSDIESIYSMYAIIDKDDTGKFQTFKAKEIAKQTIEANKKMYNSWDNEVKSFYEKIQIGNFLEKKYWL